MENSDARLALLHRISSVVSSDQDIEAILREMVTMTVNVTGSDATLIYLTDHATQEMVLRASQLPHDAEIGKVRLKPGEGVTGWVASNKSVIALARNAASDARFKTFGTLPEDTFEAFLSVPIVDAGTVAGVINVHHRTLHEHSADEIALVAFIGEQMRGVIARARLAERSQRAVRRMGTLAAVAQAISGQNYIDRILQAISEMLAETLDSAVCSILIVDDKGKDLTVRAARCSAPDYLNPMPVSIEGSLTEHVVRHGSPVVVPDIHRETRYNYPELARTTGLTSVLAAPLLSQGKAIGSINIYTRDGVYTRDGRTFGDAEIAFVSVAAGQAAIAIQNARLMAETVDMKRSLEARKLIDRAKGILQHKHGLTEDQAYTRLRDESRRVDRSMRDLAEAIILTDSLSRTEGKTKPPA